MAMLTHAVGKIENDVAGVENHVCTLCFFLPLAAEMGEDGFSETRETQNGSFGLSLDSDQKDKQPANVTMLRKDVSLLKTATQYLAVLLLQA